MFSVLHSDGSADDDPPREALLLLYGELTESDPEHGDVAVVHEETGFCISAHRDGRVVYEHLGDGGERHMIPVSKERVLELWSWLIDGEFARIEAEPWRPGYADQ